MSLTEFDIWYRTRYRRTSSALTTTILIIFDLIAVMMSFGAGFFLVNLYDFSAINFRSFVTYWPYLPAFIIVFYVTHLYPGISLAPAEELRRFTIASLMAHGGIIMSRYVEDQEWDYISIAFIVSFLCSMVILLFFRSCARSFLAKTRLGGIPAVIYGNGATGQLIVDRLLNSRQMGYIPVLILDNNPETGEEYRGIPIIADTSIGPEIVSRYNIKMAIVAMPELKRTELAKLLNYSVAAFRYSVLIPNFFGITNIWMSVRDFDGILGFASSHKLKMPWNLGCKRFMDLSIVVLGGLIISPLLLFLALLVKTSSPGPVLYGHTRLGKDGKPFKAYKFRSMVVDADERLKKLLDSDPEIKKEWEASHKLKNDPRVTKVGKFLRKTSLDEFPQIFNIIKGEMSLVGPRPIVQDEVKKYGQDFYRIFSVKPGLSGMWQVSGRSNTDYSERISYDTYYLESWSVWLDLWILYKTVGVVIRGKGAY
ncbi:undecaprenyl-phosphate galactose phosphotransferase WbaP [Breznakiella homolactica]|uniref:Undecaprenyl-phosphate galactose phosphotransferase WbaP n=1 Tax=Breznakiella homolactica TaxID=2798577 RepID=A0A7T7XNW6_9SPIR|nr:undecaprenyl-phosphate galactose phosphotransferase WbaP [Breznakiella homolactica]QQO09791.1 undecaprenyl-phosphate galactose phosphotransferase WbaP [Breznakiella homolactica]